MSPNKTFSEYAPSVNFLPMPATNYLFLTGFSLILLCCSTEQTAQNQQVSSPEYYNDSLIVPESNPTTIGSDTVPASENTELSRPTPVYPFLRSALSNSTLAQRITPPAGYQRIALTNGTFAEWLRYLPLHDADRKVHLFNGELKSNQSAHAAIINIDVGKRDLQQCADAVMRLRAEYLFGKKDFENIHFNFTSGDRVAFEDWSKGRKPRISGNKVIFTDYNNSEDVSYSNFRKYMNLIFSYAGTASLSKELQKVSIEELEAGDVFIQGGFPGHAVIVLDVAQHPNGEKVFLLAQSYMPAQEMHVLRNPMDEDLSPWYSTNFRADLITPEWRFTAQDLMRFEN